MLVRKRARAPAADASIAGASFTRAASSTAGKRVANDAFPTANKKPTHDPGPDAPVARPGMNTEVSSTTKARRVDPNEDASGADFGSAGDDGGEASARSSAEPAVLSAHFADARLFHRETFAIKSACAPTRALETRTSTVCGLRSAPVSSVTRRAFAQTPKSRTALFADVDARRYARTVSRVTSTSTWFSDGSSPWKLLRVAATPLRSTVDTIRLAALVSART